MPTDYAGIASAAGGLAGAGAALYFGQPELVPFAAAGGAALGGAIGGAVQNNHNKHKKNKGH